MTSKVKACTASGVEKFFSLPSSLAPPPPPSFSFSSSVQLSRGWISYFTNHKRKNTAKQPPATQATTQHFFQSLLISAHRVFHFSNVASPKRSWQKSPKKSLQCPLAGNLKISLRVLSLYVLQIAKEIAKQREHEKICITQQNNRQLRRLLHSFFFSHCWWALYSFSFVNCSFSKEIVTIILKGVVTVHKQRAKQIAKQRKHHKIRTQISEEIIKNEKITQAECRFQWTTVFFLADHEYITVIWPKASGSKSVHWTINSFFYISFLTSFSVFSFLK